LLVDETEANISFFLPFLFVKTIDEKSRRENVSFDCQPLEMEQVVATERK
jgi:hypothetical protein